MCKHPRHLTSVTGVEKYNMCAPTSPLIRIPCAPILQVREAGIPHPRKKIKTYLDIMGFLWALEWRKK